MYKKLWANIITGFIFLSTVTVVDAGDFGLERVRGQGGLLDGEVSATFVAEMIGRMLAPFVALVGIVLFAFIVYAGYLWLTAGGNDDQVKKAKKIILNGVIGLVIVLFAYILVTFVLNQLDTVVESSGSGARRIPTPR